MNLTEQTEIALYVEEVRQALADLPATTREELLEDLPEHLAEVLAEGPGTLTERLGTPQAYAAELRASAGVTGSVPRPPGGAARLAELRGRLGEAVRRADVRVGPLLGYAKASEFLALLRPGWWVLRGYLAAMAFAILVDGNAGPLGLLPRLGDNELVGLLLAAAFIVGSIWLGRRGVPAKRLPRLAMRAATVGLALFAVVGFFEADGDTRDFTDSPDTVTYINDYQDVQGVQDVQDVFVYDGQGRLVQGAQLFDQNGNPIRFGEPGCVDEATGNWYPARGLGYPYCPERAPFRAAPSPSEPSSSPSASSQPTPSESPSIGPSAGK
ncbi:hypothetical protein AB0M02_08540 [Actinoplanes sp. NPDC051861]|uniref:HAAS signaling domain-containing protein n=1 Tax=Actinoplanes sp. NPDC051861 TaxID=3155170 RepID=UPI0034196DDD